MAKADKSETESKKAAFEAGRPQKPDGPDPADIAAIRAGGEQPIRKSRPGVADPNDPPLPPELSDVIEEPAEVVAPKVPKSQLTLTERVTQLEAEVAAIKQSVGIRVLTPAEAVAKAEADAQADELKSKQKCEREIRKYVKRNGGYRAGLDGASIARAKELLKSLGRSAKNPAWDEMLIPV